MDDERSAVQFQRHTAILWMDCPTVANAVSNDNVAFNLEDMLCLCLPSLYPWLMMDEII